jgi:hypothetical protein
MKALHSSAANIPACSVRRRLKILNVYAQPEKRLLLKMLHS